MSSVNRRRLITVSATVIALGLFPAADAFAHAHLKLSDPAANATITKAPSELKLTFSESVEVKFSGATLTGPDKKMVKTGPAAPDPKDKSAITVPISGELTAGKYTVSWHNLSTDGHKLTGSFVFTVKP